MLIYYFSIITNICISYPEIYDCIKVEKGKTWKDYGDVYLLQSINRRNNRLRVGQTIVVPKKSFNKLEHSPFEKICSMHRNTIIVDLKKLVWGSYDDNGVLINWGVANGGSKRCLDTGLNKCTTPIGEWKLLRKGGYITRSKLYPLECINYRQCGFKMYWYMGFAPDGAGLHGAKVLEGKNSSHGCVRLFIQDARWLNKYFINKETKIIILPY